MMHGPNKAFQIRGGGICPGVYVLGGKCPGGKCPGGKGPGGYMSRGKCPGGTCPVFLGPVTMLVTSLAFIKRVNPFS